jgi:hypothetical protein
MCDTHLVCLHIPKFIISCMLGQDYTRTTFSLCNFPEISIFSLVFYLEDLAKSAVITAIKKVFWAMKENCVSDFSISKFLF